MRAFYKSRLFWCGVPGLVFLVWAWWDSGGYESQVGWMGKGRVRGVLVSRGAVGWVDGEDTLMRALGVKGGPCWSREVLSKFDENGGLAQRECGFDVRPFFERGALVIDEEMIVDDVDGRVAMWGVMACYAVIWLGAVGAWQWRKRRVMKGEVC
ncbi:hypothetical protein [Luteolibacter soli]|uniref:Transmembrane protein n=1 Tax=Luteolibacter soli TaxID=3135280 RepID=A0ABU9AY39_9BACT